MARTTTPVVKRPAAKAAGKTKAAPAKPVAAARKKAAAGPAASAAKARLKLVRDSFTMPQQDFGLIATLKQRALALQRPAKKSELLRAGLQALQRLPDEALLAALESLAAIKTGRPKKGA